ncbi:uncharacterized protein LOC123426972 isoform X1 [Hordeum vulgare subsp. vulgare]|uniref:uncharacterized protein LOC123426972 isoform X1 n=1 Tax=Hordeum vulgare subsp. vulgare TaxID=112509 RepID=UPI001D1A3DB9|nr:uncharacterized protein LOC123426972 isoform X1 [Hordeum vulgare subsp. vulgare]
MPREHCLAEEDNCDWNCTDLAQQIDRIWSRVGWASKERSIPCIRSRAGCASIERSTPEGKVQAHTSQRRCYCVGCSLTQHPQDQTASQLDSRKEELCSGLRKLKCEALKTIV